MRGLLKLLVLLLAIGLTLRFGLPDPLADMLHHLAREAGIPAEMAGGPGDPSGWPSPGMIYEFLGSLPAPWGGLAKMLLVLTGISLVCALILWLYLSVQRMLGWLRDILV